MLSMEAGSDLNSAQFLRLFLPAIFAQMAATTGAQSLESSLCLSEGLWREFESRPEALKDLQNISEVEAFRRDLQLPSKPRSTAFNHRRCNINQRPPQHSNTCE